MSDRTIVGRILEEDSASTPRKLRWFWCPRPGAGTMDGTGGVFFAPPVG
jgi:hypothetical protein